MHILEFITQHELRSQLICEVGSDYQIIRRSDCRMVSEQGLGVGDQGMILIFLGIIAGKQKS